MSGGVMWIEMAVSHMCPGADGVFTPFLTRAQLENRSFLTGGSSDMATARHHRPSARVLAFLQGEETFIVDFKLTPRSVDQEDFVQFANSPEGGVLLVGVQEEKDAKGRRMGKVVGCPVNDDMKQALQAKALNCSPPIQVQIIPEQSGTNSFYRIEVPSGPNKPYCTGSGTYKIRADGRMQALLPSQLLTLFLETEGGVFLRRFQEATGSLETALGAIHDRVERWAGDTEVQLTDIFNTAENANANSDEAMSSSYEAASGIHDLASELEMVPEQTLYTEMRLAALLKHLNIEDPVAELQRRQAEAIEEQFAHVKVPPRQKPSPGRGK